MRTSNISESITEAITRPASRPNSFLTFFSLFHLKLVRFRPEDLERLRSQIWGIEEYGYKLSFRLTDNDDGQQQRRQVSEEDGLLGNATGDLVPVGDLGYSGSTFFNTPDGKYLIKSLPRSFEYLFFTRTLFDPYVEHMMAHAGSLLARITDVPHAPHLTLGGVFGLAPTHHIVMENLLHGKKGEEEAGWETFDLKPHDYFFPERDFADGRLAPESVKDRLVDTLPHKIVVAAETKRDLLEALEKDTELLRRYEAVDYSLFLARYPASLDPSPSPPPGAATAWRKGVTDVRGEWTYRAIVLDFFWCKATGRARMMEGLVGLLNCLGRNRGPMSITAEPGEYRERFLGMVRSVVRGEDEDEGHDGDDDDDETQETGEGSGS
ncbi:hypothetical protein N3K66_000268 [Trichothecium roseum]|uniref:Uncharacterized protein n=1 Tax=Trichothecium roseum TaxID=47278 RepID=A0ACC0VBQ8_9HYPO|nr:hypothetical protein N3K66_000268 [Trichothecium roseum]